MYCIEIYHGTVTKMDYRTQTSSSCEKNVVYYTVLDNYNVAKILKLYDLHMYLLSMYNFITKLLCLQNETIHEK